MKTMHLALAALGLTTSLGFAFDMPRGIRGMAELEEARAAAAERPEPLAFVITKVSLQET